MLIRNPIDNAIFEILLKLKSCSVEELIERLQDDYQIKLSRAQIYNIIKDLREKLILFRDNGKLSFNHLRIERLAKFVEEVR